MNPGQLRKLGVPESCIKLAVTTVRDAIAKGKVRGKDVRQRVASVLETPKTHLADPTFGPLAQAIIEERQYVAPEPVSYQTWGGDAIDAAAHSQMQQACNVPVAAGAALMADAHVGYGLPIGGVLACENAVIPYAVGVDIACRMKLSVLDIAPENLNMQFERFRNSLEQGTRFGIGAEHQKPQDHAVMDRDWSVARVTREAKDKAWKQLGTSGSGNHFVEFGTLELAEPSPELGLEAGSYVALLSHSGSRGVGAAVCTTYSSIARERLPKRFEELSRLAWLDLDSEAGQEYWQAMNLMGEYAAANHEVIHRLVSELLGAVRIAGVENHHNFAWKEIHDGKELIVHRKGATPASLGEMGVIPGTMADPAFIVRGKGNPASLRSASHGAGRRMSRKQAHDTYRWKAVKEDLAKRGVQVLSADADESPGVYKDIHEVMRQQEDLVEIVGRFDPRIVKMAGAERVRRRKR